MFSIRHDLYPARYRLRGWNRKPIFRRPRCQALECRQANHEVPTWNCYSWSTCGLGMATPIGRVMWMVVNQQLGIDFYWVKGP